VIEQQLENILHNLYLEYLTKITSLRFSMCISEMLDIESCKSIQHGIPDFRLLSISIVREQRKVRKVDGGDVGAHRRPSSSLTYAHGEFLLCSPT
jgi:hypothetical protein